MFVNDCKHVRHVPVDLGLHPGLNFDPAEKCLLKNRNPSKESKAKKKKSDVKSQLAL